MVSSIENRVRPGDQQRLAHQGVQQIQNMVVVWLIGPGYRADTFEVESTGEHRTPFQQCLFGVVEQVVGPSHAPRPAEPYASASLLRELRVSGWSAPRMRSRSARVRSNSAIASSRRPADRYACASSWRELRVWGWSAASIRSWSATVRSKSAIAS